MKPYTFYASRKPFTVQLDRECLVTGYSTPDDRSASFYNPIRVKEGDTFQAIFGRGIILNGKLVVRKARPLKKTIFKVSWVAKTLRIAVFLERDAIYNRRTKKFTKKLGKPYWVACDLRSYEIGCGKTLVIAMKRLLEQCQGTNLIAAEGRAKGHKVVRWRCLLEPREVREMEKKARKTGFILDGVKTPPLPKAWVKGLKRLKARCR